MMKLREDQSIPRDREGTRRRSEWLGWLLLGGLSILLTIYVSAESELRFGEALTRYTARLSLLWYWLAALGMLYFTSRDWMAATSFGRTVRWCWTWGAISFLVHVLVAFHFYHHWSHHRAFAHVEHASRFGYGIYVSYLFTLLWGLDAILWWLRPEWTTNRSPGLAYIFHAFMVFMIFNATLVFETGSIRWLGSFILGSLAVAWGARWWGRRSSSDSRLS